MFGIRFCSKCRISFFRSLSLSLELILDHRKTVLSFLLSNASHQKRKKKCFLNMSLFALLASAGNFRNACGISSRMHYVGRVSINRLCSIMSGHQRPSSTTLSLKNHDRYEERDFNI